MTIKVFVGCAANHEDAESQAVLEYSLRHHASEEIEITWMKLSRDPASPFYCNYATGEGWNTSQWATPFTALRWAIPELCGFKGKAVYTDSDVIFTADIAELWRQELMPTKCVIAKADSPSRLCVSLWDCAAMQQLMIPLEQLRPMAENHREMTRRFVHGRGRVQAFIGDWNCLDGEHYTDLAHPDIKAIHYTSMRHQPHLAYATERLARTGGHHWFDGEPAPHWRPDLQALFDRYLDAAIAAGYPPERYCEDERFGPYRKKSVAQQGLTVPPWGKEAAA